jgi:hypothetical protein
MIYLARGDRGNSMRLWPNFRAALPIPVERTFVSVLRPRVWAFLPTERTQDIASFSARFGWTGMSTAHRPETGKNAYPTWSCMSPELWGAYLNVEIAPPGGIGGEKC